MNMDNRYTYELVFSLRILGISKERDIVGAIFGQLKDILKLENMDIEKLSKTGRIGFMRFELNSQKGDTTGHCFIPVSLDLKQASILASGIEMVEKIGPSKISLKLEDITNFLKKRVKKLREKSKKLFEKFNEIFNKTDKSKIKEDIRKFENLGEFIVGKDFKESKRVILTEGRADLILFSKIGYNQTIAMKGLLEDEGREELCKVLKGKFVYIIVDGDKGGKIILEMLRNKFSLEGIEFEIVLMEDGKNVQDLSGEELSKIVNEQTSFE